VEFVGEVSVGVFGAAFGVTDAVFGVEVSAGDALLGYFEGVALAVSKFVGFGVSVEDGGADAFGFASHAGFWAVDVSEAVPCPGFGGEVQGFLACHARLVRHADISSTSCAQRLAAISQ
jgi:hypothetical protein